MAEEELSPTASSNIKHIYENYVTEEKQTTTRAIVHQESYEDTQAFLTQNGDPPSSYFPQLLDGSESPPFDCNKTLSSSKSDRTM